MPLLESLLQEKAFSGVVGYRVDYDNSKGFRKEHRVPWQTTVIVFKGKQEVGRSTGDLDVDSLRSLIAKGL